jgi:hypothetical protein
MGAVAVLIAVAAGCAEKDMEPWTPKPFVHWNRLAAHAEEPPQNSYRILAAAPTRGLFPAAIGVSRVGVRDAADAGDAQRPYLLRDPRNECLQWNKAFDDQMAVSEVFPIAGRDLGGADANPEQILAAMHALGARIGLIYAMNELSETETAMYGALYETATGSALASFHAQAESVLPPEGEEELAPEDLWDSDSKALVRARFEHIVHTCVRELVAQDQPAEIETPDGWTPAGPIRPVTWPPRPYAVRRPRR